MHYTIALAKAWRYFIVDVRPSGPPLWGLYLNVLAKAPPIPDQGA